MLGYLGVNCQANLKDYCQVLRASEILFSLLFLSEMSVAGLTDNHARSAVTSCLRAVDTERSGDIQHVTPLNPLQRNQNPMDGTSRYSNVSANNYARE